MEESSVNTKLKYKNGLLVVEDEETIEKDLENENEIRKIELNLKKIRTEYEQKKKSYLDNKISKIENEKTKMINRLEEIISIPKDNDYQLKLNIVKKKKEIEKNIEKEIEKDEELRQLKKEQEIEKIVLKKIELEKLLEKKNELNSNYKKIATELDVIRDEQIVREMNDAKILHDALNTGGLLEETIKKGALTEHQQALLANTYLNKSIENERQKSVILSEIQSFKKRDLKSQKMDNQEKIKKLNEIRFDLLEKEQKLLKEKALHNQLVKKGIPFLAEIELGNAPPKELIEKNLKLDGDYYRDHLSLTDFFNKGKEYIQETKEKIDKLKDDFDKNTKNDGILNLYLSELKKFNERANPESLHIARQIIFSIINLASVEIEKEEEILKQIKKQSDYLLSKKQKLDQRIQANVDEDAINFITSELAEKICNLVLRESAGEIANLNLLAKTVSIEILLKALSQEKTDVSLQDLNPIFLSLRDGNLEKRRDKIIKFNFVDQNTVTKLNRNKYKTNEKEKNRLDDDEILNKNILEEEKEINPLKETEKNQGNQTVREKELEYWDKIVIETKIFIDGIRIKSGYSTISISENKKFIMMGAINNSSLLYSDLLKENAQLFALDLLNISSSNIYPISYKWGIDSSQSLTLLNNGTVKSFIHNGAPKLYEKTQRIKDDSNPYIKDKNLQRPLTLFQELELDWRFLSREKFKFDNEKEKLKISFACFFPSFNMFLYSDSIIVGCYNGVIMKFNNNKTIDGAFSSIKKDSLYYNQIISEKNQPFPANLNPTKIVNNTKNEKEHVFREFFIGHQDPIIFINFINNNSIMISIDESGLILLWKYSKEFYFSKFEAFSPNKKIKIISDSIGYVELGQNKILYPNKNQPENQENSERLYYEFINIRDLDQKIINETVINNEIKEVLLAQKGIPEHDEVCVFTKYVLKENDSKIMQISEQEYKGQMRKGKFKSVKGMFCNKSLILQNISEISEKKNIITFFGYDTQRNAIKNLKIVINPKSVVIEPLEFDLLEEFQPFYISYLLVLVENVIEIYSLATGIKVKTIEINLGSIGLSQINNIAMFESQFIIISSKNSSNIGKLLFKDNNLRNSYNEILKIRLEYFKLFSS